MNSKLIMVIMESTLFDGKILFFKPSNTLFNILRLAALRHMRGI